MVTIDINSRVAPKLHGSPPAPQGSPPHGLSRVGPTVGGDKEAGVAGATPAEKVLHGGRTADGDGGCNAEGVTLRYVTKAPERYTVLKYLMNRKLASPAGFEPALPP